MAKSLVRTGTSGRAAKASASRRRASGTGDGPPTGLVEAWVQAGLAVHPGTRLRPENLIRSLKSGLPIQELDDLRRYLEVPMEQLAPMLGISRATLHRRKVSGRLDAAESDRVLRFARLLGRAGEVMESLEAGRRWLTSRQFGLGGAVPLEYAETEVGAREVEDLLGRIEHGVYS